MAKSTIPSDKVFDSTQSFIYTVHIAFGSPVPGQTGANWDSKSHVGGVIKNPTIYVDGEMLMNQGDFCFGEFT